MANNTRVRDKTQEAPERVRTSEQKKNLLTTPKIDGYVTRWVNDSQGGERVRMLQRAGWVIVEDETPVGDAGAVNQNQTLGSGARKYVGAGTYAILMKKREDWYNEDSAADQAKVTEKESHMFAAGDSEADYGKVELDGVKKNKHRERFR
jgi:hypothetical protein